MATRFDILDVCCGSRMFYFDKKDPRVLFQDIRKIDTIASDGRRVIVDPDIIGDFRSMTFPDNTFNLVVFDPPQLLWTNSQKEATGWQMTKYGYLDKDWRNTLRLGFSECFRVLKDGGFLIFKWNETDIPVSKILDLTEHKPILGHKSGKRSNTHWILFEK